MMKILIINGHPDKESYNFELYRAYKKGAAKTGTAIEEIILTDLNFNPILKYGYRVRTELEPDLLDAWNKILRSDHIVWIFPLWWGFMPALLKGFIDRVFLPELAFKYRTGSEIVEKLLKGKTAHIICTLDYPVWYYKLVMAQSGIKAIRKMILSFCGIKTTRTTYIGPIRNSSNAFRKKKALMIQGLASRQL